MTSQFYVQVFMEFLSEFVVAYNAIKFLFAVVATLVCFVQELVFKGQITGAAIHIVEVTNQLHQESLFKNLLY